MSSVKKVWAARKGIVLGDAELEYSICQNDAQSISERMNFAIGNISARKGIVLGDAELE